MRDQTTHSGYDQPQTDPIQPLGDAPENRATRADEATVPAGTTFAEPGGAGYADATPPSGTPMPAAPIQGTPVPGRESMTGYAGETPDRTDIAPGHADDAGRQTMAGPNGEAPSAMPGGTAAARESDEDIGAVLFGGDDVERFRGRWRDLQADFVDDPTQAVQGADELVGEVMRTLNEIFAEHKHELEGQWQGGGSGETEELRVAMRRYRSFFDQLLDA
jgi:hypothetical protein